jgi:LmbE family N-acetylglucosaminyl deacetylase
MIRILVVAAHPDDEALGCGGTLARHTAEGDRVEAVFLTDGVSARAGGRNEADRTTRQQAANAAAEVLGIRRLHLLGFPDNRLDSVPLLDVVQRLEAIVFAVKPDVVYTHHGCDLNADHRVAHQAVVTACRPLPGTTLSAIYGFETLSSTEWSTPAIGAAFLPERFVNIAPWLTAKLQALECYRDELREYPHPRSRTTVEALARLRGSTVGLEAAEAFAVVRQLVR